MIKEFFRIFIYLFPLFYLSACGSVGGNTIATIEGPNLSLSEAQDLRVNQIFIKEGVTTNSLPPSPSVYLQDAITLEYMACAGPNEGLDVASETGVTYGNLAVPLVKVEGAPDANTALFNVIVVANQDNPCPAPIASNDTIIGNVDLNFGELLDSPINIGSGAALVTFIGRGHEDILLPELSVPSQDALTVGEIYFEEAMATNRIPSYLLVLYLANGATFQVFDAIYPDEMPEMRGPGVVYSKLDLAFLKTAGLSSDNLIVDTKGRIELQRDEGIVVGRTEDKYISDMIDKKIEFTNGKGYIKLKGLVE